jgi:hypothetical protein
MFRLFYSHHLGACYMSQRKNNVYIFQDTVIYINILRFLCSGKQQNIFNILFIILTHAKFKLKNTNVNNCMLENIHIVLTLYYITSTLVMARNSRNMSVR